VRAVGIGAHVVEFHLLFGPARLRLEEDGLAVRALGARVVLGPRQRRVRNHVGHDLRQLVNFVHNLVDVNTVVVSQLFVVAIPACIEESPVLLVLLWVEHVVAD